MNTYYAPGGIVTRIEITRAPTPDEVIAVIDRAIEVLHRGWCQRYAAVDATGVEVGANTPSAAAWCAAGALERAAFELAEHRNPLWQQAMAGWALDPLDRLVEERYGITASPAALRPVAVYNDHGARSAEDVVLLLKEARERLASHTA